MSWRAVGFGCCLTNLAKSLSSTFVSGKRHRDSRRRAINSPTAIGLEGGFNSYLSALTSIV